MESILLNLKAKCFHVPRSYVELYLDEADTSDACYLMTLCSQQKVGRILKFGWLTVQIATEAGDVRASFRLKYLHVARIATRLSGHVDNTVARNYIATQEVSLRHAHGDTRPAGYIIRLINHFEWEVPDDAIIGLHALVRVL